MNATAVFRWLRYLPESVLARKGQHSEFGVISVAQLMNEWAFHDLGLHSPDHGAFPFSRLFSGHGSISKGLYDQAIIRVLMDEISRCILAEVFDELGRDTLDLHALMEIAGGSDPARRDNIPGAVGLLVRSGALDLAGGGDVYRRTEQGRLAVAKPRDATLYSRPKCRLCDEARAAILPILREFGATLHEVNIDDDKGFARTLHQLRARHFHGLARSGAPSSRHRQVSKGSRRRQSLVSEFLILRSIRRWIPFYFRMKKYAAIPNPTTITSLRIYCGLIFCA